MGGARSPGDASPLVQLSGVGVRFRLPAERIGSFKEYVIRRLTRRLAWRELWALRDVDVILSGAGLVGIVGPNGAGKSTLLKVVSRVLRPTCGRVLVRGRLAPLLELGAGFHPDLTGRENVFLNAALLGVPREIVEGQFRSLVAFAELDEFIDLPLRNYSNGMVARLGFSVATLMRPDILILDEVLAVGDANFQRKCLATVHAFCGLGTCVLFVSHNLDLVERECERVVWLDRGRVRAAGGATDVLQAYRRSLAGAA